MYTMVETNTWISNKFHGEEIPDRGFVTGQPLLEIHYSNFSFIEALPPQALGS